MRSSYTSLIRSCNTPSPMTRRLLPAALLALTLSLAGCGGGSSSSPTTTATTPGAGEMTLTAYFVRDGKVAPVDIQVPRTKAVATAALQALIDGPPTGFET